MIRELRNEKMSDGGILTMRYDHLGKYRISVDGELLATCEDLITADIIFDLLKENLPDY